MSDPIREALEAAREAFENCPGCADRVAMIDAALREMDEAKPVVWMQSTHLDMLAKRRCGSQSMMARCSDHQLHPDYRPLYAAPPDAERAIEEGRGK